MVDSSRRDCCAEHDYRHLAGCYLWREEDGQQHSGACVVPLPFEIALDLPGMHR